MIVRLALLALLCVADIAAAEDTDLSTLTIMTVTGPIKGDQFGVALPHEHVMVDFIGAAETGPHRWARDEVVRVALPYLEQAKQHGCTGFVECTPTWIGKDPLILRTLAERTGMHILTNTGYYAASGGKFIPPAMQQLDSRELSLGWIAEAEHGIGNTGIKPGFIKIGVNGKGEYNERGLRPLTELDLNLVAAAGSTHRATGLTINIHCGDADGLQIADLLNKHFIAGEAIVWVHANGAPIERALEAARLGVWISFDGLGDNNVDDYVARVQRFIDEGLVHRLLISHDRGWYSPGEPNGGNFKPFTPLFEKLIPALREAGIGEDVIDRIVRINPAEAFAVRVRLPGR